VDPSALIFVALAVAWAFYLVPKALQHHDEAVRSRSVERFSHTMRVLARREPVGRREARLVVTPGRTPSTPTVSTKASTRAATGTPLADAPLPTTPLSVRRAAAQQAARRRRRVLGLVLLANAVVVGLAVAKVVTWPWVAVPATLLVAWLVACRLMVKGERAAARRVPVSSVVMPSAGSAAPVATPTDSDLERLEPHAPAAAESPEIVEPVEPVPVAVPVAAPALRAPGSWDMVPTTLPTYVSKPAATRRTVQTIDLESTGVWSSGRSDSDSALAREAEQREASERAARDDAARRATGS
jgi:hypothetical protein